MQLDRTRIAIRERSLLEILDLHCCFRMMCMQSLSRCGVNKFHRRVAVLERVPKLYPSVAVWSVDGKRIRSGTPHTAALCWQ